jgi:amidase
MARTVTDCALMLDCMVGFDVQDQFTGVNLIAGPPKGGSFAANLDPEAIKKARIGIVRQLFGPDSDADCKAVNTVIESAFEKLRAAGTILVDVEIENLNHYMYSTPTYYERSRADINSFLATKPNLPNDIADIVPKTPQVCYQDFTSNIMHAPLNPTDDPVYIRKLLDRDEFQRRLNVLMASENLDALAFPDVQIPAPKHEDALNGRFPTGEEGAANSRFPAGFTFPVNTLLASQARIPAVTIPAGFTVDGLPVGLELASWEYREQALLELARGVEVLVPARKAPPSPF